MSKVVTKSELAHQISATYGNLKSQGKRTDLQGTSTYSSLQVCSALYGVSERDISRYCRIDCLIKELKEKVDNGIISVRVAVAISHLRETTQSYVNTYIDDTEIIVTEAKVVALRVIDNLFVLSKEDVYLFFSNSDNYNERFDVNLGKLYKKYSLGQYSRTEIVNIIDKALELYFR